MFILKTQIGDAVLIGDSIRVVVSSAQETVMIRGDLQIAVQTAQGSTIMIGDDIRIVVHPTQGSTVKLGIEAPKNIKITPVDSEKKSQSSASSLSSANSDNL